MSDGRDHIIDKGEKPAPPSSPVRLTDAQLAGLHQSARLETTLFDLAKQSLGERSDISGESTGRDNVYNELNRIMGLNNYQTANISGKRDISDKDLPNSWNNVRAHQEFKLYDSGASGKGTDPSAQEKEKIERQIKDETSTVPVELGEGYYQVWLRMHPGFKPEDVSKEAHRIKVINGNREVLKVGERLPTATQEERERELEKRLKQKQPAGPPPQKTGPQVPVPTKEKVPPAVPVPHKETNLPPERPTPHKGNPQPGAPISPKEKTAPPNTTPPGKPIETGPNLDAEYLTLIKQHNLAAQSIAIFERSQGIIGKTFDGAKNTIGASGEGRGWCDPRRLWSGIFDSDLGSKKTNERIQVEREKLDRLKQAVDAKDATKFASIYKEITGQTFDPNNKKVIPTAGTQAAKSYDQSQHNGVDAITDIGVAVAVAASIRSGKVGMTETLVKAMGTGAVVGGITKAGLMQIDGKYAHLGHDLAVGSLMGATVPIGELGGSQLSRTLGKRLGMTVTGDLLTAKIETQGAGIGTKLISAAAKSGTSGAIFGAIESPGRVAISDIEQGRKVRFSDLALASVKGSVTGFIGGTVLGASIDSLVNGFKSMRPGGLTNVKSSVNGVDVPASGGVGLEQAAKILKMDPADLAQTAVDKPYTAVSKAVQLYEKTGLNISKVNPVTGESVLPKAFDEALTTVQHVDVLTAETATKLSSKVKVVEATDQFLKAQPSAVDDPLTRVVADKNYQEVVRLKTAQEGQPAAEAFQQKFRQGFEKDLKTTMAVQQVKTEGLKPADALKTSQPEVEAAYKQKAADYFKDMTDPAQRQHLHELVDEIYTKFNPESLTKSDLDALIQAVPEADRELAVALLHESAGTSSDSILKARFQALKSDISTEVGSSSPNNVYTLEPDSSANLLGYLYRKSNSISMDMHNIDKLAADVQSGYAPSSIVLFDDLGSTSISKANMELLKKIPRVYVVDVGAFEKAINVIDISKGQQAVAEKLAGLLVQARAVRAANPGMLSSGIARETLQSSVDAAAKSIGPNVKIIRPSANLKIPNATAAGDLAKMADVDALHAQYNVPKATKEQIAKFLSGYVGEERELAARMLAEGAVHNSFPAMVKKAVDLHGKLTDALDKSGMKMSDLLVVSDKDPGGSTHLVSYLFGKVNGLPSENFVSSLKLNQMISGGKVRDKAIAYFDDTIYTGSQTTSMLNDNVSSFMPFKKVVIGGLGAYDQGVQSIKGSHLGSLGKVDVQAASMHHPFYSQAHPFYSKLGSSQQYAVKNIGGSEGFGSIQGSLIWSYMYPDNNLSFFGSKFSGSVLRLPGP